MIEIAYPSHASGEPRPMKAAVIHAIAAGLRSQLFRGSARRIEVAELARRAARMRLNGRDVRVIWDLAHKVHDNKGTPVLGICEHDPQEPRAIMISLDVTLADEPELFRSTAAHELGHAVFDMPAAIGAGARQTFRTRRDLCRAAAPIDWSEWRADEFMGAFLVPAYPLSKSFTRCASAASLRLRWSGKGKVPVPAISAAEASGDAIDSLTDMLAEEFGVSPGFMAVRLQKYGHISAS